MHLKKFPHLWITLITVFFAVVFTFVPTREAHAEAAGLDVFFQMFTWPFSLSDFSISEPPPGTEIGLGVGWLGQLDDGAKRQGFHFLISPGHRFLDWVGIYVDQGLGGLYMKPRNADRVSSFVGHTVLNVKFYIPHWHSSYHVDGECKYYKDNLRWELWAKIGAGVLYIDELHSDGNKLTNEFAAKVGIGYTYYFDEYYGVGGNVDYMIGVNDDGGVNHYLDVQAHFRIVWGKWDRERERDKKICDWMDDLYFEIYGDKFRED